MITTEQLRKFKIFTDANDASLELLGRDMTERSLKAGEVICREGEMGGALFLIVSGSFVVEKQSFQEEVKSKVVARLEAGEFFGEMAFLQGMPYSATVSAKEPSIIFELSRTSLENIAKKEPKAALDHVMTVSAALSSRLRSTTRELVTVFEIARVVGAAPTLEEMSFQVMGQLALDLGTRASLAFYSWNPYNEEYVLVNAGGTDQNQFPPSIEVKSGLLSWVSAPLEWLPDIAKGGKDIKPLPFTQGHLVITRINMLNVREGLFVYYAPVPHAFTTGDRQMMDTVSSVLAPALSTARLRDEESARQKMQQIKQTRYPY